MKKIIKRLLLFTSAATIATSSIAYKLSHDTQTGFIKDLTDFFSDDNDFSKFSFTCPTLSRKRKER